MIAQNLDQIDLTLDNKALNETNYNEYYIPTLEGRSEDPTATLIRKLKHQEDKNLKILFAGFKGCGKSTELLRLKRELDETFVIRIFSVRERLDPNNFSISEILLAMMNDLFQFVKDNYKKIKLSEKLLQNLNNWSQSIYTEEEKHSMLDFEASTGINVDNPLLKTILGIFAKLQGDFKAGRKYSEITKKEDRQTLSELIFNCNLLLSDIKHQLDKINKKNIIFIIEDLEKTELSTAEELFYKYSAQLTAINCCAIYTYPISLVFNTNLNIIQNEFDKLFILPMIKVHDKEGNDFEPGINTMAKITYRRIKSELISEDVLRHFIKASGGCLRDLFRMIKLAADNALNYDRETIEEPDFKYGFTKLKTDYFNSISYNEKLGLDANDFFSILTNCCNRKDKRPADVKGLMELKHNLCILGYNTDTWFDVHPAVKAILEERGL